MYTFFFCFPDPLVGVSFHPHPDPAHPGSALLSPSNSSLMDGAPRHTTRHNDDSDMTSPMMDLTVNSKFLTNPRRSICLEDHHRAAMNNGGNGLT